MRYFTEELLDKYLMGVINTIAYTAEQEMEKKKINVYLIEDITGLYEPVKVKKVSNDFHFSIADKQIIRNYSEKIKDIKESTSGNSMGE